MRLFATFFMLLQFQARQRQVQGGILDPIKDVLRDGCPEPIEDVVTDTLLVNQINEPGFGEDANKYAFGMASFGDYVYVGTSNIPDFENLGTEFFLGLPLESEGAEIWRAKRDDDYAWERVFKFTENPNNYGARKMLVVGDYLYVGTANHEATPGNGAEVWKTMDGETWTMENTPGFGDPANLSSRSLGECGGYLYVGLENRQTAAKIYRRALEADGDLSDGADWQLVLDDGFADFFNFFISEFLEFEGSFYAGTLNGLTGMELWKTDNCDAVDPEDVLFTKVFDGITSPKFGIFDWGVITLVKVDTTSLGEVMFLGTVNYILGASLFYSEDGESFETIFQYGTYSVGGTEHIAYVWSMALYNNRLYIGTFNQGNAFDEWLYGTSRSGRFGLLSLDPEDLPRHHPRWHSPTSDVRIETEDSFGFMCYQDGIRNMVAHDGRLIFGTAGSTRSLYVFEGAAASGTVP